MFKALGQTRRKWCVSELRGEAAVELCSRELHDCEGFNCSLNKRFLLADQKGEKVVPFVQHSFE